MADTPQILGQAAPATGYAAANLFTVGAGKYRVVSSLIACNTSGAARLVRVWQRIAGAAAAVGNAIEFDVPVAAGESVVLVAGLTFGATDVLTVASDLGGVTFTANGTEGP